MDATSPRFNRTIINSNVTPALSQTSPSVLCLKQSHVKFEAPNDRVSVFFDECNRDIISIKSSPDSGSVVTFQATDRDDKVEFPLTLEKRILSIKFNCNRSILAYHVEKSNIEFINVKVIRDPMDGHCVYVLDERRYIQASRTKNSKLLGFLWTGPNEIVIITDLSVEYYSVDPNRRRLKHIKSFQSSTNWFVYQPTPIPEDAAQDSKFSILMVSTGSVGHSIQPYLFISNQMIKLERFLVEGDWHGDRLELFEQSITISRIYGYVRLLVLQHESLNLKSKGAQIVIYTTDHESRITTKTHTLNLDTSGRFAINVLEDLVIAHDQPSKRSLIFDIMLESSEKSDCPKHYLSIVSDQSIRPSQATGVNSNNDMYSVYWVFFQPNYIIDVKMGILSTLHLDMKAVDESIQDNRLVATFLSLRRNSEQVILDRCERIVRYSFDNIGNKSSSMSINLLADISSVFETLSKALVSADEPNKEKSAAPTKTASNSQRSLIKASITQEDVNRRVFKQIELDSYDCPERLHFVISLLLEFIFLVRLQRKTVDFVIYQPLVKCLIEAKLFYQLVQMLRSEILEDSKQLACHLLCLRTKWQPAGQLGIDMLHRLDCFPEFDIEEKASR